MKSVAICRSWSTTSLLVRADQPVALFDKTTKATIDKIRETHRPGSDADELDRQRAASKIKRWTDRDTGIKQTLISLDPLRDASLHAVIDAHLATLRQDPANKTRSFDELRVEAVMTAVSAGPSAQRIPEVIMHVDHQSACHGRHDNTLCETVDGQPIPVSTVQRMCCEAIITAVIVNPDGTVDQLCEELRTANRAQRRQLAAMYSTCAHPHCQVAFSQCRIHHIIWWTRGGKTVLANLLPLCETHHHQVHEGGWNLSIDEHTCRQLVTAGQHAVANRRRTQPKTRPTTSPSKTTRPAVGTGHRTGTVVRKNRLTRLSIQRSATPDLVHHRDHRGRVHVEKHATDPLVLSQGPRSLEVEQLLAQVGVKRIGRWSGPKIPTDDGFQMISPASSRSGRRCAISTSASCCSARASAAPRQ